MADPNRSDCNLIPQLAHGPGPLNFEHRGPEPRKGGTLLLTQVDTYPLFVDTNSRISHLPGPRQRPILPLQTPVLRASDQIPSPTLNSWNATCF